MKTVLLVDDSATVRSLVKVHLMGRSLDYVEADDGARGLRIARLVPVSLVIADVNMPVVDGISFVKQLRADVDTRVRNLPVILLTGEKDKSVRSAGIAAGANAFVLKPVASNELLAAVDQFLPQSQ